jgi:hypothetical protein
MLGFSNLQSHGFGLFGEGTMARDNVVSFGNLDEAVGVGGRWGGGGRIWTVLAATAAGLQFVRPEEAHAMVAPPFCPPIRKPDLKDMLLREASSLSRAIFSLLYL